MQFACLETPATALLPSEPPKRGPEQALEGQRLYRYWAASEVAHLLGHSSPAITLSAYSHWFKDMKTDAVTDWAQAICGTAP